MAGLDPLEWFSLLSLLAIPIAVLGLWYAHRSAKAADRSAAEAARSADATERQAGASERQAVAAEAMVKAAAAGEVPSSSAEPPAPVRWRLSRVGEALYRLRNVGTADAVNVHVAGLPPEAAELVRFPGGMDVAAGHAVDVTILSVWGPAVDTIEVRWDGAEPVKLPLEE